MGIPTLKDSSPFTIEGGKMDGECKNRKRWTLGLRAQSHSLNLIGWVWAIFLLIKLVRSRLTYQDG